jgi:UDP-N-acetylmuramate--alanine ligase
VIDDYAHHPTEVEMTLGAARARFPEARLVVAFQPHLYSRTRDFAEGFGEALALADVVWVTDVFPAREAPIAGVTGRLVADAARAAGAIDVRYHADLATLPDELASTLRGGDMLLTLGAGSIESLGADVLQRLAEGVHA